MRVTWTDQQRAVIAARDRDILVSAAAGSGKTTVLTERIFDRINDREHPIHVDDLLIVTFTEAAARQMRSKIRDRLTQAIGEQSLSEEERSRLREQLIRLPQAQISTIHGFCLEIIRNWFHVIDLDPDFRICADDGERKMIEHEVMDELLEEEYSRHSDDFMEVVESYGSKRDDTALEEWILSIYHTALSFPQPAQWLSECTRFYEQEGEGADKRDEMVLDHVRTVARELKERTEETIAACLLPGGPYPYEAAMKDDLGFFESVMRAGSMEEVRQQAQGQTWTKLGSVRKDDAVDEEAKKDCRAKRDTVKKTWNQLVSHFIDLPEEVLERRLAIAYRQGCELVRLVLRFDAMFTERKRKLKIIDFSDMEHLALEILHAVDDRGLDYVAAHYRAHFAEVMVDEYQDSNYLQEAILTSVSGGDRYNFFMVGDVKQSIYRFRNARPEMFIKKQDNFVSYDEQEESDQTCIFLSKNFRSDRKIIDFVNSVFERLMDKAIGGIEYDEDAALNEGAGLVQGPERQVEAWIIPYMSGSDKASREAALTAERIRRLISEQLVTDKETGQLRPARYSDIAILSRSFSNWAEDFYEALTGEGIPLVMERREGYFKTQEVSLMIETLKLIGNARQDLPLAAVMTSCIGQFTDDELARIRVAGRQYETFHEAVRAYRESGEYPLRDKVDAFMKIIESYREQAPYIPVHQLLTRIMDETGVLRFYEAMPGGLQRRANLDLLADRARAYAETGYRGLPRFLDYIDKIDKQEIDAGEAGILDENADVVRMTTIHKSKGLEYPIVILVGMGRGFNLGDRSGKILLHPKLGLGLESFDIRSREKSSTTVRDIIRRRITCDELGEEMRVLYVAMTRAKEKLIMTGCVRDITTEEDAVSRYGYAAGQSHRALPLEKRMSAGCYYDWVLPVVLSCRESEDGSVRLIMSDGRQAQNGGGLGRSAQALWDRVESGGDTTLVHELQEQMEYSYPYEAMREIPQKVSVSELKRKEDEAVYIPEEIPRCAQTERKTDGARMGTVIHTALRFLDFSAVWDEPALDVALDVLAAQGYFEKEEAAQIDRGQLLVFLQSELCARMAAAQRQGKLYQEQPFVIGVDSQETDDSYPAGETVLVQGIIDAYFVENDQIVLVDYKSDRKVDDAELTDRYREQLRWYARALHDLTGMTVREKVIYSLSLGHAIVIE